MINGKTVLGVITARGGSKGIPKKNIRQAAGKPLIAWTIEAARRSQLLDRLVLSSDDDAIIQIARSYDCEVPFKRAAEISQDDTPSIDVVLDALQRCPSYDWVVLLQPTSPLRSTGDIDGAIRKCTELEAPACVSVCEATQSPFLMFTLQNSQLRPVTQVGMARRRQEMPTAYLLNGAVYVAKADWLREKRSFLDSRTVAFEMPADRSLDIDDEGDFAALVAMLDDHSVR